MPELLPCGYLVGGKTSISVCLKGNNNDGLINDQKSCLLYEFIYYTMHGYLRDQWCEKSCYESVMTPLFQAMLRTVWTL